MIDEKLCQQILLTLESADRQIVEEFLKCGQDAVRASEGAEHALDLISRASARNAHGDVVDQCDKAAQIIYEGCCDSGQYSGKECAAISALFFDHCCTVFQP